MFQKKTSNVFKVHCNGYNFNGGFLNYLKPVIMPHIEPLRKAFVCREGYYKGSRFSSDDSVFTRISSALYDAQLEPSSLTQDEINHLINSALSDCASADHYYAFEKDWG